MIRKLLWIDAGAGLTVGILGLLLLPWLSRLFALPEDFLMVMGIANVAYGCFSFSLARRQTRPRGMLKALVIGNAAWAVLCAVAVLMIAPFAAPFGIASVALEGVFVGGLAVLEWRHRELLYTAQ